jgi:DNA-3-methyladenine glycosylase
VAPRLLGQLLVRRSPTGARLSARIVEVEAYRHDDPASHAFRGPTPRNAVMFGPPGHLYVYFTYGMHWCMNVVTGSEGEGAAVLLRAGVPLDGLEEMIRRRGGRPVEELCAGPARWTQAFAIDRGLGGADLVRGAEVWIERGTPPARIEATPRVGVTAARDRPWRFVDPASAYLSRRPSSRPSRLPVVSLRAAAARR